MNIVYTFDNGYSEIAAVSIVSLFENNKHVKELNMFIVDCGISDKNKRILDELSSYYGRKIIYIKSVNIYEKINIKLDTRYWSDICYIRLFFAELLPNIDRVMHVDCDTIVRGDVSEIYNIDMGNNVCAACYDCNPCPKYAAGFDRDDPYYSNGFLIFDLNKIRSNDLIKTFVEYIEFKNGKLPHLDQDVINGVLHKSIYLLPAKYNLMTNTALFGSCCKELFEGEPYYSKEELKEAVNNPIIVHLIGFKFSSRPWAQPCYHPYNKEWIEYYSKTKYWNEKKMLIRKRKKYGILRECACWIWNQGYKIEMIRRILFKLEKSSTNKLKAQLISE